MNDKATWFYFLNRFDASNGSNDEILYTRSNRPRTESIEIVGGLCKFVGCFL